MKPNHRRNARTPVPLGILVLMLAVVAPATAPGVDFIPTSEVMTSIGAAFPFYGYSVLEIADLNVDGHLDLVLPSTFTGEVALHYGNGAGGFSSGTFYAAGGETVSVLAEDFNEDGRPDLVTCNNATVPGTVTILRSTLTGYEPPLSFVTGSKPVRAYAADINEDGNLDLVVVDEIDSTVGLLVGSGLGTFAPPQTSFVEIDDSLEALAIEDLNLDGHLDLIVPCPLLNMLAVLLGNGVGGFQTPVIYPVGTSPGPVGVEDFDDDGFPDVLVPNRTGGSVSWLRGIGAGLLAPAEVIPTGGIPLCVREVKNGSTIAPLAAYPDGSTTAFHVAQNFSSGTPPTIFTVPTSYFPEWIESGDFDEDGLGDLAVVSKISGIVQILLQSPPTETTFRRGDVETDGLLTISDAIALLEVVFSTGGGLCPDRADANDDGRIDLADPIRVLTTLFGGAAPLPAPETDCGNDPTTDSLTSCAEGCVG